MPLWWPSWRKLVLQKEVKEVVTGVNTKAKYSGQRTCEVLCWKPISWMTGAFSQHSNKEIRRKQDGVNQSLLWNQLMWSWKSVQRAATQAEKSNKAALPPAFSAPLPLRGIKSKLQQTEGAKWARAACRPGLKQLPHLLPGRTILHSLKGSGWEGEWGGRLECWIMKSLNRKGNSPLPGKFQARGLESYE